MNIGVLGLGYVGVVNVACFSGQGHTVYCTDVKQFKVQQVADGKSPIHEPEVEALLQSGIENGNIIPTMDMAALVSNSDILVFCVGTPSKADGEVNLSYLNNVTMEVSSLLHSANSKYLAFRSTVPPGTTEEVFERHFGNRFPQVIPVFYPEFLREGSAVYDFLNYGRLVLGKRPQDQIDDLVHVLHVNESKPVFITDIRTAEYSKYIDNGFHALKVAFANEVFGLASDLKVDVNMAHKIFVADTKLNISPYYTRPGLPFGGSCLPKDLREMQYLMKKSERSFSILNNIIPSNEAFIRDIYAGIKKQNKTRIAFAGITFKNHSDDLREGPLLKVLNQLHEDGKYEISIADDDLNTETLRVDYPHLFSLAKTWEKALENAELIVVSKRYLEKAMHMRKPGQWILNYSENQGIRDQENFINLYN